MTTYENTFALKHQPASRTNIVASISSPDDVSASSPNNAVYESAIIVHPSAEASQTIQSEGKELNKIKHHREDKKQNQPLDDKRSRLLYILMIVLVVIATTAIIIAVVISSQCQQNDGGKLCDSNPCENNGTCVSGNDDYACKCQGSFYGNNCEKTIYLADENSWKTFGNGFQYLLTNTGRNWNKSRAACQDMGGDLAVEGMKNLTIRREIVNIVELTGSAWIGLRDFTNKRSFEWVDGSASTKNNIHWLEYQPDNWHGNEYCGAIGELYKYLTNDAFCKDKYPAICEKKLG